MIITRTDLTFSKKAERLLKTLKPSNCREPQSKIQDPSLRATIDKAGEKSLTEDYWFRHLVTKYPHEAKTLGKLRKKHLKRCEE